ncbi:hypothetical protein [Parafrankia colletiae]|uniref:hypothetical protein n=1 Tax=Parafrankia colletiae TaxID=573497 RepID=UPI0038995149
MSGAGLDGTGRFMTFTGGFISWHPETGAHGTLPAWLRCSGTARTGRYPRPDHQRSRLTRLLQVDRVAQAADRWSGRLARPRRMMCGR